MKTRHILLETRYFLGIVLWFLGKIFVLSKKARISLQVYALINYGKLPQRCSLLSQNRRARKKFAAAIQKPGAHIELDNLRPGQFFLTVLYNTERRKNMTLARIAYKDYLYEIDRCAFSVVGGKCYLFDLEEGWVEAYIEREGQSGLRLIEARPVAERPQSSIVARHTCRYGAIERYEATTSTIAARAS